MGFTINSIEGRRCEYPFSSTPHWKSLHSYVNTEVNAQRKCDKTTDMALYWIWGSVTFCSVLSQEKLCETERTSYTGCATVWTSRKNLRSLIPLQLSLAADEKNALPAIDMLLKSSTHPKGGLKLTDRLKPSVKPYEGP